MSPEFGRAGFRIGMIILVPAIWLLLTVPRDSAGFAITALTAIIALVFMAFIAVMVKFFSR